MEFIKLLKYVRKSFHGKPSFLVLMGDDKEYISNGCVFAENTPENREKLIAKYDCKKYINDLLAAKDSDMSEVTYDDNWRLYISLAAFNVSLSNGTAGYDGFTFARILTETAGNDTDDHENKPTEISVRLLIIMVLCFMAPLPLWTICHLLNILIQVI